MRRLHDTDRSAWWLLISFIPFGSFALLYFMIEDSDIEANRFGPSPKYEVVYAEAE